MAIEFRKNLCGTIIAEVFDGVYNTKYPYAEIEIPDGYEVSINDAKLTFQEMEQILAKMKEIQETPSGNERMERIHRK